MQRLLNLPFQEFKVNKEQLKTNTLDAIVIGAGPSGLSAGYQLKKRNLSYLIVEASNGVLSSYRYMWDNFKIAQPVKEVMVEGLDFHKFPSDHHLKRDELIRAYEDFATKHQLNIQCDTMVFSINKTRDNNFEIKTNRGCYTARNVIVALSMNAKFRYPTFIPIQVQNHYKQIIMHSAWYQGVDALQVPKNANLLVVGSGLYALTVAKECREKGYKVSIACGNDDKQIAKNNPHLPSIPIKLTDLTKMGIPNFGRLVWLNEDNYNELFFEYKHDAARITDYHKIIFATGYSYSPDLICKLLDGCVKNAKEHVLNHVDGAMPALQGIYLVGMPPKGRNTTTFAEGDKFAANVATIIARKYTEEKIQTLQNTTSLAVKATPSTQSVYTLSGKVRFWGQPDSEDILCRNQVRANTYPRP